MHSSKVRRGEKKREMKGKLKRLDRYRLETRVSVIRRICSYLVYLRGEARGEGGKKNNKKIKKKEWKGRERNINSLAFNYELNQI